MFLILYLQQTAFTTIVNFNHFILLMEAGSV